MNEWNFRVGARRDAPLSKESSLHMWDRGGRFTNRPYRERG